MKNRNFLPALSLILTLVLAACSGALPAEQTPPGLSAVIMASPSLAATASATIEWFPVSATETPPATSVPSATLEPFPGLGRETFSDQFSNPNDWSYLTVKSDSPNKILIDHNHLTLAANVSPVYLFSLRHDLSLVNFYAEVNVSINRCQSEDQYGLLFRTETDYYTYRYVLTCDGRARVERMRGGELIPLMEWAQSGDIPPGAPGEVTLGIWAAGTEYRFFVNGHYQFRILDPTFKTGTFGVFASAVSPAGMNVNFSGLTVRGVDYVSPTPTATPSETPLPSRTPSPTP